MNKTQIHAEIVADSVNQRGFIWSKIKKQSIND